jgi:DNA-3-methyladenine glycosylase
VTGAAGVEALLAGPVIEVAPRLIGMRIRTEIGGAVTEVMLTEVEAYAGEQDPASHAFRGRTARNGAMFGPPGTLYVYRSYGLHWCMNVVTGMMGLPHAVLLRGGVPVAGEDTMVRRRGRRDHIADGPGKLTQALGVAGDHDGTSVLDGPVRLLAGVVPEGTIVATPRIGITKAADRPWRFVLAAAE